MAVPGLPAVSVSSVRACTCAAPSVQCVVAVLIIDFVSHTLKITHKKKVGVLSFAFHI